MGKTFRFTKSTIRISLLLIALVVNSCNTLKRVDDDELLLKKNTIYADSIEVKSEEIKSLIVQEPNTTLLGYPLRLNLHNLAKKNPDSSYQVWLHESAKREQRLINFLSKKQVDRLGKSFLVSGLSEWLKKVGEAPAILDTTKTRRTLERLRAYYGSKGYFNNNTTYEIDTLSKKRRAMVAYKVDLGHPFMIDSVSKKIASRAIDSIYTLHKAESFVKSGDQFDLTKFASERERLSTIFRNSGIYNFQESSISYDIATDTTKLANDQKMNIELNIDNFKRRGDSAVTSAEYKVYKFDKINIYTDYLYDERDSEQKFIRYGDYTIFYRNKLRFKPKTLANAVFFEKDSIYKDIDRTRTYRQITSLGVFKYPTITSTPNDSAAVLDANIYLAARPKYSLGTSFEVTRSNIQQVGLALSPSLQARNLFGGAENLNLAGRLSIGSSNDPSIIDSRFFNIQEFGADLTLDIPRFWFPFINTSKIIPSYTLPRTRISVGTSFQKNIGLDKQAFSTVLGYNWTPSDFIKHNIELLNIQFVKNVNPDRFFNVYQNSYEQLDAVADNFDSYNDAINYPELTRNFETSESSDDPSLRIPLGTTDFTNAILNGTVSSTADEFQTVSRIEERRQRLTEDNLIFASNYTLNLNNREGLTDNQFYQFRFKFESAGNVLSLLSNIVPFNENDSGDQLVFSVPYSQYLKTEFDYVKYWATSRTNVLAFRSFFGIAIPYGNSDNIPFVRSYFAGGANDIRAWSPYSLGPGSTDAINDFNEANLKIELNLEYRFPVIGNMKGALFADAGNIWNVFDNVEDPAATFTGFKSLEDVALGTGFGLRYDFTYFILRADLGFKTYNPAEEMSKRWFRDYNFANAVLQIGINYPF
ncbi:BamA/TamA family outer membrane protein [Zobellia galactanivorans]|uniref:Bacterial surface antigen n=1 Tax=Zobellia galactanivorans (strain DSM 12802 / CCUG 47099 / CIP 106680 / NCIMB 13871 / Dsij) TaxID=63186 RepID=G0L9U2_ZOBGA|nr:MULTISPECIES: BamA/TamA family outer membrane protein [Zobellia]MBU3027398.1 BamA/TamA family outer membrane protein [Zobellia galactanivorans]MDO6519200.1 BamA/TamA family outer membrane protein [Zobellia uliginosa]MDO6809503.1 BamA/TamA family outer membrane protein [Zobellia galactanivorans]CAZ94829.1 Bacterial surface antigen [Zobellia galactanivorans]